MYFNSGFQGDLPEPSIAEVGDHCAAINFPANDFAGIMPLQLKHDFVSCLSGELAQDRRHPVVVERDS